MTSALEVEFCVPVHVCLFACLEVSKSKVTDFSDGPGTCWCRYHRHLFKSTLVLVLNTAELRCRDANFFPP